MNARVLIVDDEPQITRVLRRHKLEPDPARPRHLRTEPGMGYRFSA